MPITIHSNSPEETQDWAADWAASLPAGTIIALHGNLGTGKTCFVQGLAKGLKIKDAVHSPTFTLINEYQGSLPLYHLDLYRLSGEEEAWDIGIDQYIPGDGITAIEWADRIEHILPATKIDVFMDYGENSHQRTFKVIESSAK